MDDQRVQAIRCEGCKRLRPHPTAKNPWCLCGGRGFRPSGVFPDEEAWAIQIYESELKERELWKHT